MHWPSPNEFDRLSPAEQQRIRDAAAADAEQAASEWRARAEVLLSLGATRDEIVRDFHGDPTIGINYDLD